MNYVLQKSALKNEIDDFRPGLIDAVYRIDKTINKKISCLSCISWLMMSEKLRFHSSGLQKTLNI